MAELDLGTLEVKLQANIDQLRADFAAAQKETKRTADEASKLTKAFNAAFNGTATAATRMAGNFNQLGESITKVFGENGLSSAKKFASEVGVSTAEIEGISVALKGLGGAFSAVAVAAGAMSAPIAAALAMVVALIAAYGALKKAAPQQVASAKSRMEYAWAGTKDDFSGNNDALLELAAERNPDLADQLRAQKTGGGDAGGGIEIAGAFKESMAAGLEDFKGIIEGIKTMFAPDQTKKEQEEKKKLAAESNKAERERQKALQEAFAEQAKIYDEEQKVIKDEIEARKKAAEEYADLAVKSIESALEGRDIMVKALTIQTERPPVTKTTGNRIGAVSIATSDNGGPTMSEEELDRKTEFRNGLKSGAKDIGDAALQGSGVGDYVAAFQKGGGIIGGIINVVLKLFEKSEGFKTILSMVNDVVQMLADGLGQIFDGLQPIIGVIGWLVQFFVGSLQPILSKVSKVLEPIAAVLAVSMVALEGLAPLLDFFAQAIGRVLQAIGWILQKVIFPITQAVNFVVMKVAQGISWVINDIIDLISKVIWEVGAILQKFGAQDAGSALKAAANAMHEYEIDTKAINDAANAMWDMSYDDALKAANDTLVPLDDLGDSAGDAADSIKEFSEAITNVPSGYKVALARFNATTPVNAETVLGGASTTNNTFAVTIKTDDAASLWSELKKLMERDSVIESGSPISGAPEFLAA